MSCLQTCSRFSDSNWFWLICQFVKTNTHHIRSNGVSSIQCLHYFEVTYVYIASKITIIIGFMFNFSPLTVWLLIITLFSDHLSSDLQVYSWWQTEVKWHHGPQGLYCPSEICVCCSEASSGGYYATLCSQVSAGGSLKCSSVQAWTLINSDPSPVGVCERAADAEMANITHRSGNEKITDCKFNFSPIRPSGNFQHPLWVISFFSA